MLWIEKLRVEKKDKFGQMISISGFRQFTSQIGNLKNIDEYRSFYWGALISQQKNLGQLLTNETKNLQDLTASHLSLKLWSWTNNGFTVKNLIIRFENEATLCSPSGDSTSLRREDAKVITFFVAHAGWSSQSANRLAECLPRRLGRLAWPGDSERIHQEPRWFTPPVTIWHWQSPDHTKVII